MAISAEIVAIGLTHALYDPRRARAEFERDRAEFRKVEKEILELAPDVLTRRRLSASESGAVITPWIEISLDEKSEEVRLAEEVKFLDVERKNIPYYKGYQAVLLQRKHEIAGHYPVNLYRIQKHHYGMQRGDRSELHGETGLRIPADTWNLRSTESVPILITVLAAQGVLNTIKYIDQQAQLRASR
ncbi:hypothetical protein A3E66_05605 [Candidatus Daviesbacteria bacterium RIFCSPHIGHO2_12_FULL_37_16]|uniref:Uncharacterized protein n=3 Tax=Candidatus Daviesiibacteriota TaxID=1752718 RepID=A0A0G0I160_9BACT|nr:MAG: hypothetical protein US19_C0010G0027 [Candidatus Daviesbacteria bacterium GW2011_GWB1_36_5]KKQ16009.1 MAG: hypothetical protein US28_C0006G0004 [Candidatus Daviesbacteria bacterium GW2011_GWA1_36_8]OGE31498.1 MAG: hypothetical protein A3C99_03110 [Candidatus Daviesbacteria bacterium RIFCSPHIGHO2_02_FULL_37_9]OGE36344.1 MAG: hypothetical protein A3E66_05605 [Candidatus Daviesbacteria bacterium RIFCSPHIGHO2_12_FULL_37_16]